MYILFDLRGFYPTKADPDPAFVGTKKFIRKEEIS